MRAISGKQFCRLIESRGWRLKRVRGSHHIYVKTGTPARISVPVHSGVLKRGLQKHLMKIAQIQDYEL
ncbi:MAG: type II toxin-antitoxin system HicA family toxin [Bryobacterales bacterium]|nr:type II toxin-antitoxin system HicA family toxin [Bryobacterales bacterium]